MNLPSQYAWLHSVDELPLMVLEAIKTFGVYEFKGALNDNPIILGWAKEVGVENDYKHDETSWCGLHHSVIAKRANKPLMTPPNRVLWALNWATWGVAQNVAMLGDTLVKKRFDTNGHLIGGHVTTYIAEDNNYYHCMGGNQSDMVNITRILKTQIIAIRRPNYNVQPKGVKQYFVNPSGIISSKEN